MANRKFVVVDRDICAVRQPEEDFRKELYAPGTERTAIREDMCYNILAITKDEKILWSGEGGVVHPSYGLALKTLVEVEERAMAVIKQAEEDLRICRKVRQALEDVPREFGHQTKPPGPFSGLLKRRNG